VAAACGGTLSLPAAVKGNRLTMSCNGERREDGLLLGKIEGGLHSVTALRETWVRRRCILNTRIYHKQASTTSKAHFRRRSSSSSGSHSASSASVASCGVLSFRDFVLVGCECVHVGDNNAPWWPQGQPGPRPDPARLSGARARLLVER